METPADAETIADVVAAGRDREGAAVAAPDRAADYAYPEFATNARKAGNLLRHYGVRPGASVALLVGPKAPGAGDRPGRLGTAADPLLGLFGAFALGATVDPVPAEPIEARAAVLPAAWIDRYEFAAGCSRLAYGGPPEASDVAQFERELWSENPVQPPGSVAPDAVALRIAGSTYTQNELLRAGRRIAEEYGLGPGDRVGIDAPLTTAGAVAAGAVAPLSTGATIVPGADTAREPVYVVGTSSGSDSGSHAGPPAVDPTTVL